MERAIFYVILWKCWCTHYPVHIWISFCCFSEYVKNLMLKIWSIKAYLLILQRNNSYLFLGLTLSQLGSKPHTSYTWDQQINHYATVTVIPAQWLQSIIAISWQYTMSGNAYYMYYKCTCICICIYRLSS